ncbi:MAG: 3-keto-disaccharide hydrolase [Fimbriiglobus sp.]
MKRYWLGLFALVLCTGFSLTSAEDKPAEPAWVPLFDGKTLDGWKPKIRGFEFGDNHLDTFSVKDGYITVNYDKYDKFDEKFGHLFYKDKFSHYKLRVEYRFIGAQCKEGPGWATRNSGAMLHCQDPKTMTKDQDFPVSVEVQFLGGLGKGNRTTCNMCSPGTNIVMDGKLITQHCVNSKSKTFDGDQWVTAEIEVHGDGVWKHFINGELVMEYEKPQLDPKDAKGKKLIVNDKLLLSEGWIALQAESHPCQFRKVEIQVLKK